MASPIQSNNQSNANPPKQNSSEADTELKNLLRPIANYINEPTQEPSQQHFLIANYIHEPTSAPSQQHFPIANYIHEPTSAPSQQHFPIANYIHEPTSAPSQQHFPIANYIHEPTQGPPSPPPPPPSPPPPTTPPPKPIDANKTGRVSGDPHFQGFGGPSEKYDVHGKNGRVYNILSDKTIQFNAKFTSWHGQATIVSEAGLQLGKDKIDFKLHSPPKINGQKMKKGQTVNLEKGNIIWNGKELTIKTNEYTIKLTGSSFINASVTTGKDGVFSDGVMPHGLLGQTADGDGKIRHGHGMQGNGAIQGTFKDYEVSNIFSNKFAFNQFNPNA